MYTKLKCEECEKDFDPSNMFTSGTGIICQWCAVEDEEPDDEWDDGNDGCKADTMVDFDFERLLPATCSECGKKVPQNELDLSDSEPLCRSGKDIDWCDACGSGDCYCHGETPVD